MNERFLIIIHKAVVQQQESPTIKKPTRILP